MKPLAAVVALSASLAFTLSPAHAFGPSTASALSVGVGSFVVVSALPVMLIQGVSHVVTSPFRARVTTVTPVPGQPGERKVEAVTTKGETLHMVVPAKVVDAAAVAPGTNLVAETSQGGLIISAGEKPFVLATGGDNTLSKHVAL